MAIFDHAKSVKELIQSSVDVFMGQETADSINVSGNRVNILYPFKKNTIGPFSVTPFECRHDVPCLGYQISDGQDTLVFATDTGYCRYTFPGITILMIEANFSEKILWENCDKGLLDRKRANRVFSNHMSIERVVEMLKANDLSKLREVRLLHLSDSNSDEAMFKRMIQEVAGVPVIVEG